MSTNKNTGGLSAIDAAINKAKANKDRKAQAEGTAVEGTVTEAATTKRPRLSDTEKLERQAKRDADRQARKEERVIAREAKRAERDASKVPAHMAKVTKAATKLPVLNDSATVMFNDITSNFGRDQINAISLHLAHFNRVKATERALNQKLEAGMSVRIVSGDPKFVGMEGTVAKAQRIRAYVNVEGAKKPIYVFTSDVEVISANEKTGTSN